MPTATATATATATPTLVPTATVTPTATPTPVLLGFDLLGVPASYNPKKSHWTINDLQFWRDRLYVAHGDLYNNTGPVRAIYFDLASERFVHDDNFAFDDEAIDKFRVMDDTLFAAGADAKESWDFGNMYSKPWGGKWSKLRTIPRGVHVWDVGLFGQSLIATTASDLQPSGAMHAWLSTDNGKSWKESLVLPGQLRGSFFILGERLFVTTGRAGCFVLDGNTFVKANCLPTRYEDVYKNVIFNDIAVMVPYTYGVIANMSNQYNSPRLYFFDGQSPWLVQFDWPVRDVVSTKDGLYVLLGRTPGDGFVMRARALTCRCAQDFAPVFRFDFQEGQDPTHPNGHTVLSLEYVDNRFYIGLADGRLFRSKPYKP